MNSIVVELPEKVSTNVFYRKHWRDRGPLQQAFYVVVQDAVRRQKVKPVMEYPIETEYFFDIPGKPLDNLNLSAMAKMVEDGLRHEEIFKDDSPTEVGLVVLHQQKTKSKEISVRVSWGPPGSFSRNAGTPPSKARG